MNSALGPFGIHFRLEGGDGAQGGEPRRIGHVFRGLDGIVQIFEAQGQADRLRPGRPEIP